MIDGVLINPLKQIPGTHGKIMHMLRCDAPHFSGFGEIYFSCVNPGAIKAWHIHRVMKLNYAVPVGTIKLVLFDNRDGSPTKGEVQEIILGKDNYCLVTIPPQLWYGFKCLSSETTIIANCSSIPHDPAEVSSIEYNDPFVPYHWEKDNS